MKALAKPHSDFRDLRPTYSKCNYAVMQHVNVVCLQFLSGQSTIWIKADRYEILQMLEDMITKLTPKPMSQANAKVLDMSADDVIAYFEQSPELNYLADELRKALSHSGTPMSTNSDLETVKRRLDINALFENGVPVYGAQSRIAKALGVANAGSSRKRVLTVLSQLQNQTSTTSTREVKRGRNAA